MSMKCFSACWTPSLGRELKDACTEPYPIECRQGSQDYQAFAAAVGQGIDSCLEAIMFSQDIGLHGKVRFIIHKASVPVLVRRLLESGDDHAASLASGICQTLGIELI